MSEESLNIKRKIRNYMGRIDNPYIMEAGTNDCEDTIEYFQIFKDPTIFGFEPVTLVYLQAWNNIKLAGLEKVMLVNKAIGNKNGKINFFVSDNNGLSSSSKIPDLHLSIYPNVHFNNSEQVDCVRLDDYFIDARKSNQLVDLFHLDVQGNEKEVIEGGMDFFKNKVKFLYTEFSKVPLYDGAIGKYEILNLLNIFGDWEEVETMWEWEYDGNVLLRNRKLVD
jgi:FkbM family methyltransferase